MNKKMEKQEFKDAKIALEAKYKADLKDLEDKFFNDDVEYFEMICEYPNTHKVGDKMMVCGRGLINFVKIVDSMENCPKYVDLLDTRYWKRISSI
jgi:hypothetical protein